MVMSFKQFLEANVPGHHLDGKGGFFTGRNGSIITSDQSGSEQYDNRDKFLPSVDMAMNDDSRIKSGLAAVDKALPKILANIPINLKGGDKPDPRIPIPLGSEYLAEVSPKSTHWGTVTYLNGVPLPKNAYEQEAPRHNIEIAFKDDKTGKLMNIKLTRHQYQTFKDLNGGKHIEIGMKLGAIYQRHEDDTNVNLPWDQKKPNLSSILGVKYFRA
jgi:hypothetical protein